jgi:hypothetical protein
VRRSTVLAELIFRIETFALSKPFCTPTVQGNPTVAAHRT